MARNAVNPDEKRLLAEVRPKFRVTLDVPRLLANQRDVGRLVCTGTLRLGLTSAAEPQVDKFFKRESTAEVEYSSQLSADGKQHVVELAGHRNPAEYAWGLAAMGAFAKPASASPAPPSRAADTGQQGPPLVAEERTTAPKATTAGGNNDPAGDHEAADKALNQAYQAARARLSEQQRTALRDEQRNWIKRRDETCSEARIERESKGAVAGGTAMQAEVLSCKAKVTGERTKQLQTLGK